jgi:hypothetical protein
MFYTKNRSIVSKFGFRRRIAVDFDGVCSKFVDSTYQTIGDPVDGAIDILANLRELGWYIVLWSSRTNAMTKEELSQAPSEYPKLMMDMIDWLERYNFPYDEIWMGGQKPPCAYFIDDRAISFDEKRSDLGWVNVFNQIQKDHTLWKKLQ